MPGTQRGPVHPFKESTPAEPDGGGPRPARADKRVPSHLLLSDRLFRLSSLNSGTATSCSYHSPDISPSPEPGSMAFLLKS